MAWDKSLPANDTKLKDAPSLIRANFEAIEEGTNAALKITNAKVADNAAIADTKLAKISTAGKVGGAALTELANIPSGAGIIPAANLPADNVKLTGDQTISSGVKTFSVSPIVPTPTTDYQAAPKKYIDDNAVKLTGNQTVAGIKTLTSSPIIPTPTTDMQASTKKYVDDNKPALGSWVDKSASYGAQQAATDGFVLLIHNNYSSKIYSDANANPTTVRSQSAPAGGYNISCITPVRKGDYWKCWVDGGSPTVYWIPLGS